MTGARQAIIGVWIPGVGHNVIWRHPDSTDRVAFAPLLETVQLAERGRLDFVFFADGQSIPQHNGTFVEAAFNGRPDSLTIIPGLAAATSHIGFVATLNTSLNEPHQLARQLASIDHLSDGRVGWNVVTSFREGPTENFGRLEHLAYEDRYVRAEEFVRLSRAMWSGQSEPQHGRRFAFDGTFSAPLPEGRRPLLVQSGDSSDGRDFGTRIADAIFTGQRTIDSAREFTADIRRRAAEQGRDPRSIKVLPGLSFVVGDTPADARDKHEYLQQLRFSPGVVRLLLEQTYGRELSDHDLDGPLPEPPELTETGGAPAAGRHGAIAEWQALAEDEGLSTAQVVRRMYERNPLVGSAVPGTSVVGSATEVADFIQQWIEADAADGFVIAPDVIPNSLADFVDSVVPLLQDRGLLRREYGADTLLGRVSAA